MFKTFIYSAGCEIRAVIKFLNATNEKPEAIYRQVKDVYDENLMNGGLVKKWNGKFNGIGTNIHHEARSVWPSFVNDDLIWKFDFFLKCMSFHLFPLMKRELTDNRFGSNEEVKNGGKFL